MPLWDESSVSGSMILSIFGVRPVCLDQLYIALINVRC